jgi:hypothetical protein
MIGLRVMIFLNLLKVIACDVGEWARCDWIACVRHPCERAHAPLPRGRETERRVGGREEGCGPIGWMLALPLDRPYEWKKS